MITMINDGTGKSMGITRAISFVLVLMAATAAASAGDSKFSELKGNPKLRSASAIVLDADGNMIYGKDRKSVV